MSIFKAKKKHKKTKNTHILIFNCEYPCNVCCSFFCFVQEGKDYDFDNSH